MTGASTLRESAFKRFEIAGLPHRRVEEWKYTDLRALMRDAKPLASVPDAAAKAMARRLVSRLSEPYTVAGRVYVPEDDPNYRAEGMASWYGDDFHGRLTANGEVFDMTSISAAHPTLPMPSYARVTNLGNGKSVIVRINDRGPFVGDRITIPGTFDPIGGLGPGDYVVVEVHDTGAGREPLHVAAAETRRRTQRITVIDEPFAHERDGLEPAVRVLREAGNHVAVIHAPAVLAGEVLTDVTTCERRGGTELGIASRVRVVVMHAEQEGIERLPGHAQREDAEDRRARHD